METKEKKTAGEWENAEAHAQGGEEEKSHSHGWGATDSINFLNSKHEKLNISTKNDF